MFWINIDKSSDIPLIRQIYEQIRAGILSGVLKAGERLPATRELASELKISRNVILEAYDQLYSEGYVESRQGSGTFVSEGLLWEQAPIEEPLAPIDDLESKNNKADLIDFRSGIPDLNLFPKKIWGKLSQSVYNESPFSAFGYGNPEGRLELRQVLTNYLLRTRGVRCKPEQLVITSGATQALSLVAKLLISPGDEYSASNVIR